MYLQIISHLCVSLLVLQFDGSLRQGGDPNEDIIPKSLFSKYLSPYASSSSALFDCHDVEDNRCNNMSRFTNAQNVISLSGRAIPFHRGLSSADVEYEGLILGLKDLSQHCAANFERADDDNVIPPIHPSRSIVVEGDCKTVIDQMNQVSKPRKQMEFYNQAKDIVSKLEDEYDLKFQFKHVLRDKNVLCDYMCKVIIQKSQGESINRILRDIGEAAENFSPVELPSSKKRRFNFRESAFADVLNRVSGWDSNERIPLSLRPYLLCEIYLASSLVEDYIGMRLVGEAMKGEAIRWNKEGISFKGDGDSTIILQQMNLIGSRLTCSMLGKMDLKKEAVKCSKLVMHEFGTDDVVNVRDEEVRQLQSRLPWHQGVDLNSGEKAFKLVINLNHHDEVVSAFTGWYEKVIGLSSDDLEYEAICHRNQSSS